MRRREFITLLGCAATWPLAAGAQQRDMPVVGFLHTAFPAGFGEAVAGLHQGLGKLGFVEGRNIAFEYRWAEGRYDRLPTLAADLVRRQVAVVFASSPPVVRALIAESRLIPIVFTMGEDPVSEGVVSSLGRPGGNVTGFSWFANQALAKRLALLKEVARKAAPLALLVNPRNPNSVPDTVTAQVAADALGRTLHVLTASPEGGFAAAFATIVRERVGGLLVGVDGYFLNQREQIAELAARHEVPAIYDRRQYSVSGGLMSYGASQVDTWRQAGTYMGRILNGEKPATLPVQQATKFEFVINLKTAKALRLDIPPGMLAIATEVIE